VNRIFQLLSYHLLPTITSAFILGIASSQLLQRGSADLFSTSLILGLLFIAVTLCYCLKNNRILFYLLIPLFFTIGFYHAREHSFPPSEKNSIWNIIKEKQEAVIVGTLAAMPAYNGKVSRIPVAVHHLRLNEWHDLIPVTGKILLRMDGPFPDRFLPGDTLAIRANLRRPGGFLSPGSFDFSQYLARKNIWITGVIPSPLFLRKAAFENSFIHNLHYFPEKVRTAIGREIDDRVSPKLKGLYRAILLGDRSAISQTVLEQFKASGTMHILAISGIHMTVIGTLLFSLFYRLLSLSKTLLLNINVKKTAALLCLPVLIFYSMLTGLNPPVIRSVIMSTAVIAGVCINRKKSMGELLFLAAFIILIFSPLQLFTASFQLSFSAVVSIIYLLPMLKQLLLKETEEQQEKNILLKISKWTVAGLLVSTAATLATAPLSLYYFNRLSLIGPLANIILEPLICLWSLACGIIAIPFLFLLPPLGDLFLQAGCLGLRLSLQIVHFCSSLPYSNVRLPTPEPWLIFLYYLLFLNLMYKTTKNKQLPFRQIAPLCITVFFFFHPLPALIGGTNHPFTISVLDVGQGSSTFLELPSGYRVIVDGGGSSYLSTKVGERVIAPYLWKRGISKIDAIIVTHPDADHYNGLPFIVDHFAPSKVWLNTTSGHDMFFTKFVQQIRKSSAVIEIVSDNRRMRSQGEEIRCLTNTTGWSESEYVHGSSRKGNNGLIIQACAEGTCILLPGDIGKGTEQQLTQRKYPLRSTLLLSPHHGSATSNSVRFLKAVAPEYLIVSAGKGRKNIFPHPGLERLCSLNDTTMLLTARHGTIEIVSERGEYSIYGYQKEKNNPLAGLHRFLIDKAGNNRQNQHPEKKH